jgi:DNA invertase Pin-like site-specific DNA recombinase
MADREQQRAAGYVRVSSVGGREGDSFLSPEVQREKIEAWAGYRGFRIVRWYQDLDVSGRQGVHRPQFERMMSDAARGDFDAVAVYRLTRFGRSVGDAANRYRELQAAGVDLVSVTEDFDTSTPSGRLMQNLLFSLAEFESERIGEEWRHVHAQRRRRGIAHVAAGLYGYRTQGAEIIGVDEPEAEAVRMAYELRRQGLGLGAIRRRLEEAGHRPRAARGRQAERFSLSTLSDLLRHPYYTGLVRHGSELLPARHDAIVSRELWEAVQAAHAPANRVAKHRASLLSGLLVCSGCGYRMRHERRNGKPSVYRCSARQNSRPCPRSATIRADATERYVERVLLLARFSRPVEDTAEERRAGELRQRIERLSAALDALTDASLLGGAEEAALAEYAAQTRRLLRERDEAERDLWGLEAEASAGTLPDGLLAEDGRLTVPWERMPLDERRQVVRGVVRRIIVAPATSQGGRHDRGIDFQKRLAIEWNWELSEELAGDLDAVQRTRLLNLTIPDRELGAVEHQVADGFVARLGARP